MTFHTLTREQAEELLANGTVTFESPNAGPELVNGNVTLSIKNND